MAEIGSITGNIIPISIRTPRMAGAGYICHANAVYAAWWFDKDDTGYIVYRNGVEIANHTIDEFRNAAKMFNNTDHDTNLFSRSHDKLIYEDNPLELKKFKEYKYSVRAYREFEKGVYILSEMSDEAVIKTE